MRTHISREGEIEREQTVVLNVLLFGTIEHEAGCARFSSAAAAVAALDRSVSFSLAFRLTLSHGRTTLLLLASNYLVQFDLVRQNIRMRSESNNSFLQFPFGSSCVSLSR